MPEVPKELQEFAEKLGGAIIPMSIEELVDKIQHVFAEELDEWKQKARAAQWELKLALARLGGSMTITPEEAEAVQKAYTIEHRMDTADNRITVYLKSRESKQE